MKALISFCVRLKTVLGCDFLGTHVVITFNRTLCVTTKLKENFLAWRVSYNMYLEYSMFGD